MQGVGHPVPQSHLPSLLERTIDYQPARRNDTAHENLRRQYAGKTASAVGVGGIDTLSGPAQQAQQLDMPAKVLFDESILRTQWPSELQGVGPGLENMANTCFMNSVSSFFLPHCACHRASRTILDDGLWLVTAGVAVLSLLPARCELSTLQTPQ